MSSTISETLPSASQIGFGIGTLSPLLPFSLFPAVRFASFPSPTCLDEVSFAGYVTLLAPSPCAWLSHAPSTMRPSDSLLAFSLLPFSVHNTYLMSPVSIWTTFSVSGFPLPYLSVHIFQFLQEPIGSPKFFDVSLLTCQALGTPTDPREANLIALPLYWLPFR